MDCPKCGEELFERNFELTIINDEIDIDLTCENCEYEATAGASKEDFE